MMKIIYQIKKFNLKKKKSISKVLKKSNVYSEEIPNKTKQKEYEEKREITWEAINKNTKRNIQNKTTKNNSNKTKSHWDSVKKEQI